MSDNPDVAKLQLEHARAREDRWRTHVDPILDLAETSRKMANEYAKMALQTMFWLNGGALIAFPSFASVMGRHWAFIAVTAVCSLGAFICGLVSVALATYFAYLCMNSDAAGIRQWWQKTRAEISLEVDPQGVHANWRQLAAEAEEARKTAVRWYQWQAGAATAFGLLSLVSFLLGCYFGSELLLGG